MKQTGEQEQKETRKPGINPQCSQKQEHQGQRHCPVVSPSQWAVRSESALQLLISCSCEKLSWALLGFHPSSPCWKQSNKSSTTSFCAFHTQNSLKINESTGLACGGWREQLEHMWNGRPLLIQNACTAGEQHKVQHWELLLRKTTHDCVNNHAWYLHALAILAYNNPTYRWRGAGNVALVKN